jgi:hypothetical protein
MENIVRALQMGYSYGCSLRVKHTFPTKDEIDFVEKVLDDLTDKLAAF